MTTANVPALLPPTIRPYAQSLSPRECAEHRGWIGVRVEALLEGYWQTRPSDLVKAEIMADWMDALQNYSPDEIRYGCREYLKGEDRARKPKPGDIRSLIDADRAKRLVAYRASLPPAPDVAPRVSPADMEHRRKVAEEIMARFAGRGR